MTLRESNSYILQLHKHDPDGTRFRYSTTKSKGRKTQLPSLPDLKHINIRDFAIAMEKLADYLDLLICGSVTSLMRRLNIKPDM